MNIVLLSGGSGKRLWPLSNDIRSKQFIPIFKDGRGGYESMVQRMYRQIRETDPSARIVFATSKAQIAALHNQLGDAVGICPEPARRDTFPAMILAAVYLNEVAGVGEDEPVAVCPVDPYVEADYFGAVAELCRLAGRRSGLFLLGIEPTYPAEKYGYVIPESAAPLSKVQMFREKPDAATAERYIAQGALWNGGVFAFRLGYLLDIARKTLDYADYADLYRRYEELPKTSFDYAVAEREENAHVLRFSGAWKDLGTWNTLSEAMEENVVGEGILGEGCENVHILNELNIPILCMGLKDAVVAAGPEGILVSDKAGSARIKPYVDNIERQIMFAEKSWGSFRVVDADDRHLTIKVKLNPGNRMNYHSHALRDEIWTVVGGTGIAVTDGVKRPISPGDVVRMPAGVKHTVLAVTELHMVEVQLGREINVADKIKHVPDFDPN